MLSWDAQRDHGSVNIGQEAPGRGWRNEYTQHKSNTECGGERKLNEAEAFHVNILTIIF